MGTLRSVEGGDKPTPGGLWILTWRCCGRVCLLWSFGSRLLMVRKRLLGDVGLGS